MTKSKQYILKIFHKLFGYCHCCGRYFTYPKRRRMNTAYVEHDMNYECTCIDCHMEHEKYWEERWEDYYRGRI